nr:1,4-alpha-glucan branching enzyme [Bacillus pakistanensis]
METVTPTDYNIHLFHEGNLFDAHRLFGAHVYRDDSETFTAFCVWAPNAKQVKVVGSFNNWRGTNYEMTRVNAEGIWRIEIPLDLTNHLYKYEITTNHHEVKLKTDPYTFYTEKRPNTAGIVYSLNDFEWTDEDWLASREACNLYQSPMSIYELHLGTWKKEEKELIGYREMADLVVPHVLEHGFTHIELLPVTEHPFDRSWGYQGTGYFAPTSRYGTPQDFKYFVNECHRHGIGVILDWVPGHFCKDAHGLYQFDGRHIYEYEKELDRENYTWGTANFNLGRGEVQSFLISNARFWMEVYHIDGFRVDAVANIIYWANQGNQGVNEGGIAFLKKLNRAVFEYEPSALMIAEDSTDWPQVTSPVHYGGLGFNYKWNMGWMNDVLTYLETEPDERKHVHSLITFSLLYAFSENFILPFSHDEVVHGKKSLLNKMPGDYWQKFAQLRLLLAFMYGHPGKKLLFMGTELAPFSEWKDLEQLDWHLLDYDMHHKFNTYSKELLKLYKDTKALFELDHRSDGFEWIDVNNVSQQIFSFIRKSESPEDFVVIICNFSPQVYYQYKVGVPKASYYVELLNTDRGSYGGSNQVNEEQLKVKNRGYHGKPCYVEMTIPPYAAVILQPFHH